MDHQVMCGCQGLEDHNPAGVAGPLEERVGHLWDVNGGLLCGRDQICEEKPIQN